MPQPTRRSPKRPASRRPPTDLKAGLMAAIDKKALDVIVLDLRKTSAFTDFFVIATGNSTRQVKAIADGIQEALRARGLRPALVEGYAQAEWVLIDYFDFIFHIFLPAKREFYALERLWGDAERIEISA
jgi:ribosome-associated protein